jgi:hypothetical protein
MTSDHHRPAALNATKRKKWGMRKEKIGTFPEAVSSTSGYQSHGEGNEIH